jgi:hypothetical protein
MTISIVFLELVILNSHFSLSFLCFWFGTYVSRPYICASFQYEFVFFSFFFFFLLPYIVLDELWQVFYKTWTRACSFFSFSYWVGSQG